MFGRLHYGGKLNKQAQGNKNLKLIQKENMNFSLTWDNDSLEQRSPALLPGPLARVKNIDLMFIT